MIIFADARLLPVYYLSPERFRVLNMFSNIGLGKMLTKLFPPDNLLRMVRYDSIEFLNMYTNYVMNDLDAFQDFMEIIMANYYSQDALVLTDLKSPVITPMIECIIQIINSRYGLNPYIIQEISNSNASAYDMVYTVASEIEERHGWKPPSAENEDPPDTNRVGLGVLTNVEQPRSEQLTDLFSSFKRW